MTAAIDIPVTVVTVVAVVAVVLACSGYAKTPEVFPPADNL